MARVLKRGPRNAPKFYVQFDRGRTPDGKRLRCTRLLKGVENLPQARQEAARVEREIAAGRDPFPDGIPVAVTGGVAGPLLQQWAGMLKNRNARDDRSRITRHLLPEFEKCGFWLGPEPAVCPLLLCFLRPAAGVVLKFQQSRFP